MFAETLPFAMRTFDAKQQSRALDNWTGGRMEVIPPEELQRTSMMNNDEDDMSAFAPPDRNIVPSYLNTAAAAAPTAPAPAAAAALSVEQLASAVLSQALGTQAVTMQQPEALAARAAALSVAMSSGQSALLAHLILQSIQPPQQLQQQLQQQPTPPQPQQPLKRKRAKKEKPPSILQNPAFMGSNAQQQPAGDVVTQEPPAKKPRAKRGPRHVPAGSDTSVPVDVFVDEDARASGQPFLHARNTPTTFDMVVKLNQDKTLGQSAASIVSHISRVCAPGEWIPKYIFINEAGLSKTMRNTLFHVHDPRKDACVLITDPSLIQQPGIYFARVLNRNWYVMCNPEVSAHVAQEQMAYPPDAYNMDLPSLEG